MRLYELGLGTLEEFVLALNEWVNEKPDNRDFKVSFTRDEETKDMKNVIIAESNEYFCYDPLSGYFGKGWQEEDISYLPVVLIRSDKYNYHDKSFSKRILSNEIRKLFKTREKQVATERLVRIVKNRNINRDLIELIDTYRTEIEEYLNTEGK